MNLARISDLREILLPRFPEVALRHFIVPARSLVRTLDTSWRGEAVFVGGGFAWVTAEVLDVRALSTGGFLWCLAECKYLPWPLPYHTGTERASFEKGFCHEPIFASAGLCRDIEQQHRATTRTPQVLDLASYSASAQAEAFPECKAAQQLSLFSF